MLHAICEEIEAANQELGQRQEKQLTYGVTATEMTPMVERMFKLLEEAGLIYDNGTVKHGSPTRIYQLFIPHTAQLLSIRAIHSGKAGGALKHTVEAIEFRATKHPVRKKLANISTGVNLEELNFSLPKCAGCGTYRLNDSQSFCHHCGHQLIDASAFNECLKMEIAHVPGLTAWQKTRIKDNLTQWRTVRDFLAKQDPAADLFTIHGFGKARTAKIVDVINSFVDDYLS